MSHELQNDTGLLELSEGADQACRGAHSDDNSESYFEVHAEVSSLAACKELCISHGFCKGIEYSSDHAGRCEVWTRSEGIGSVAPVNGFTCLRFRREFEAVNSISGAACRGSSPSDNSPDYYHVDSPVASLDECKERCLQAAPPCRGVEYATSLGGRCEIWTRTEGVGAAVPMPGFECLRLRSAFEPVEPVGTRVPSSGPPATTAATTAAPATTTIATTTAVTAPGRLLSQGAKHIFSSRKTQDISVVGMTTTSAFVCSVVERRGFCSVLSRSDGVLTQGARVAVADRAEITRLSIAQLSEAAALACYVESGLGPYGRPVPTPTCRVLITSGAEITRGAAFVLDDEEEAILSLSLVGLSPSLALICYDRLDDMGLMGACSAMHVSGTKLERGGQVELSAGELDYGPEIVAARASDIAALVCYRDQDNYERAACSVLTISGGVPSKGPALVLSAGHFHSLSAAGISTARSVVCLKDFAARPPRAICKELSVSGTSLVDVREVEVFTGKTSVARLSEATALACSSDTHHTHTTACAVLSFSGSALSKGPDLLLSTTNTGSFYVAAGLSPTDGLACYEERSDPKVHRGACATMVVSAASR